MKRNKPQSWAWTLLLALMCLPLAAMAQTATDSDVNERYEYYFLEATRLRTLEQNDAAFDMLQHCLALKPQAGAVYYELAQYYLSLKQNDKGLQCMEQAVAYEPANYWYAQGLANLYLQLRQIDKAAETLEDIAAKFPVKREVLYSLLQIYSQQNEFDKAIEVLDRVETTYGVTDYTSQMKLSLFLAQDNLEMAEAELKKLAEKYPNEHRFDVMLGDFYLEHDRAKDAYRQYEKVLEQDKNNAYVANSLVRYYEQTGQTEAYERQLNAVLFNKSVDTEVKEALMRRIVVRNESEKKDSTVVIDLFDRIMAQEPDEPALPLLYAQYLFSKNMDKQAHPVLKRVLQIDPTNTMARFTLIQEAVTANDYEQMVDLSHTGTLSNPDQLEFYYYLAAGYYQQDRLDSVASACHRAMEHVTAQTDMGLVSTLQGMEGDALYGLGRIDEAFKAYDNALLSDPKNVLVMNNYAYYISLRKGDLDKAEELSYKTVKAEPNNATYLDTYAWILFEKGNYTQAKVYMDLTLKNDSLPSGVVLEHAGDIYYKAGETEKALDFWKQALEKGGGSEALEQKVRQKKYMP